MHGRQMGGQAGVACVLDASSPRSSGQEPGNCILARLSGLLYLDFASARGRLCLRVDVCLTVLRLCATHVVLRLLVCLFVWLLFVEPFWACR